MRRRELPTHSRSGELPHSSPAARLPSKARRSEARAGEGTYRVRVHPLCRCPGLLSSSAGPSTGSSSGPDSPPSRGQPPSNQNVRAAVRRFGAFDSGPVRLPGARVLACRSVRPRGWKRSIACRLASVASSLALLPPARHLSPRTPVQELLSVRDPTPRDSPAEICSVYSVRPLSSARAKPGANTSFALLSNAASSQGADALDRGGAPPAALVSDSRAVHHLSRSCSSTPRLAVRFL